MQTNIDTKSFATGGIPYVEFKVGNKITFGQDFSWWDELPSNIRFYPVEEIGNNIWLIGNKYGVQRNNEWGIDGEYGNGRVCVSVKDMPTELVDWCRENLLIKNEK